MINNNFDFHLALEEELTEGDMFSILYHIYKDLLSGLLIVKTEGHEKKMVIEDRKITFAASNREEDNLSSYLLKNNLIDKKMYNKTNQYMTKHNKRFGRALVELGYFNYDQIWTWVQDHLKTIVFSFFGITSGTYRIQADHEKNLENISLDMDILKVIIEGMRSFKSKEFLEKKFENTEHLYVVNAKMMAQLDLKPYEIHVFDLVKGESRLSEIIRRSELMEFDTLKFLYLFLVLEIISTQKKTEKPEALPEMETYSRPSTFTSFDEALRYYNLKYEIIYKVMLKEIGPISLSILLKAVEDIMDNLPPYFQKMRLNPDGKINDEILKSVWYHDFNQHIGDFLMGLEEILYTEIYTVKKHLGVEYEQQVLKWMKGIEN